MADDEQSDVATPTSLPAGVTLQDVLAALAAQSAPQSTAPSRAQLASLTGRPFTADLLSPTGLNSRALHCLLCSTVVLAPLTATHHTGTAHVLPPFPATAASPASAAAAADPAPTGQHSWLVAGQMSFENVGVTRSVDGGSSGGSGSVGSAGMRYLVCGNCDGGPIGCVYSDAPQQFYVLHGRIQYK